MKFNFHFTEVSGQLVSVSSEPAYEWQLQSKPQLYHIKSDWFSSSFIISALFFFYLWQTAGMCTALVSVSGVFDRERKTARGSEWITHLRMRFSAGTCLSVRECEGSVTRLSLISSSFKAIAGDVKQMREHKVIQYLFSITFKRLQRVGQDGGESLAVITSNQYTGRNVIVTEGGYQGRFVPEVTFLSYRSDAADTRL